MIEDLAGASERRSLLHSVAASLTDFIEAAREVDVHPDDLAEWIRADFPFADHPNLAAYLHNISVLDAMEPITHLRWSEVSGPMPLPYEVMRTELTAVLERWGCGNALDDGQEEMRLLRGVDEPARTLKSDEENRLRYVLQALEWSIFCLPRREDWADLEAGASGPVDKANSRVPLDQPIFFRSRLFFVREDEDISRAEAWVKKLKEKPGAFEAHRISWFREDFRISHTDRHPDRGRLLDILSRAKAFLIAVETCLPIEGDDERAERPFGWDWRVAEYFVCEAASALCDVLDGVGGEGSKSSVCSARGWNTEINFGLRCLDTQMEALLSYWEAWAWEDRLAIDEDEPTLPVKIRDAEMAGLRRTVETIESGIANAGIEQAEPTPGVERNKTRRNAMLGKRGQIIAVYHDHKDWTYAQIAEATGADRGHVCRVLKPLRDRDRGQFKAALPRGAKDRDGTFNAW